MKLKYSKSNFTIGLAQARTSIESSFPRDDHLLVSCTF